MELADVLRKRRMVRGFEERPLSPEVTDRILSAGLRAPTAGNTQAVDLLALTGPTQTGLYWSAALPNAIRHRFPWPGLLRAPLLVVVLSSEESYRERYAEPDKASSHLEVPWWHVDAAFAAMLIQLAAVDAGLGALFFQAHRPADLRAALQIPPTYAPVGTVAVGHPEVTGTRASSSLITRPRRPEGARIHRGGW